MAYRCPCCNQCGTLTCCFLIVQGPVTVCITHKKYIPPIFTKGVANDHETGNRAGRQKPG